MAGEVIDLCESDSEIEEPSSSSSIPVKQQSLKKPEVRLPSKSKPAAAIASSKMVDLPRYTDSDNSSEDEDFLNLPVFKPKMNVLYEVSNSKSNAVTKEKVSRYKYGKLKDTNSSSTESSDDDDDDILFSKRNKTGNCTHGDGGSLAAVIRRNISSDNTTREKKHSHYSGRGELQDKTKENLCSTESSDDDDLSCSKRKNTGHSTNDESFATRTTVHRKKSNASPSASTFMTNEDDDCVVLLSSGDECDNIVQKMPIKALQRHDRKETNLTIDNDDDDDDDDDLPPAAPFKFQHPQSKRVEKRNRSKMELVAITSKKNDICTDDCKPKSKSAKESLTQSPRGQLKDDRNYMHHSSDDYDDNVIDSPSSWKLANKQKTKKSFESTHKHGNKTVSKSTAEEIVLDFDSDDEKSSPEKSFTATTQSSQIVSTSEFSNPYIRGSLSASTSTSASLSVHANVNDESLFSPHAPGVESSRNIRDRNVCYQETPSNPCDENISEFNSDSRSIQFDDLISPRASVARASMGSVNSASSANSRRKVKVPTPAIPIKITKEIGGKLYPDFRNHFIKALIKFAKVARRAVYTKGALDRSIRAVNALALYPYPIRSADGAKAIDGVGGELVAALKEAANEVKKKNPPYNPPNGLFSSAAAAALVVLHDHESGKSGEDRFMSMEDLLSKVNGKAHNTKGGKLFDRDIAYYLDSNNIDPSWMQIRKLCKILVKERKRKTACESGFVYELLEEGRKEAARLKCRAAQGPTPDGPLRQLAAESVPEEFGNVTVVVDGREGGGGSRKLHDFCDFLDTNEVPYLVRNLKISDYIFFIGNKLAPVLIERKSIEDVAHSLHDGRWGSQQQKMRKAQYVLGGGDARKCQICYLIEGDVDKTIAHGGFVGRSNFRKSVAEVKTAIAGLPELGFSVIESKTKNGSLHKIKMVAKEFLWRSVNGSIDCTHTYDQFIDEFKTIDDAKGNPPTDPLHKNPAPPIVSGILNISTNGDGNGDGNDNDNKSAEIIEKRLELTKLSQKVLKERCKERMEKMTGSKNDLVERLMNKRRPEILISRARRKQYVPKIPSCNAAILVALHLYHEPGDKPLEKAKIMNYAEESGVSKDPMFGNGKGWYDGWSGMKDLTGGDPPLISIVKRKYALTTLPRGESGVDVAKAVHIMAHRQNLCTCGQYVEDS